MLSQPQWKLSQQTGQILQQNKHPILMSLVEITETSAWLLKYIAMYMSGLTPQNHGHFPLELRWLLLLLVIMFMGKASRDCTEGKTCSKVLDGYPNRASPTT